MQNRTTMALGVALLFGAACASEPTQRSTREAHELSRTLLASATDTGSVLLVLPMAMTEWRDSLAIVDMRAPGIAVVPRTLEGGRSFGRRGQGPGEFRAPQGLTVDSERLAVFDRGNARITWYDADGQPEMSRQLMITSLNPTFAVRDDGALLLPVASADFYGSIEPNSDTTSYGSAGAGGGPWLRRPDGAAPHDEAPITSNMVVRSGGNVYFVDIENGLIVRDAGGSSIRVDSLPLSVRQAASRAVDSLKAGAPERRVTPIIAAGAADDGIVIWLPGAGETRGAIMDESGDWSEVIVGPTLRDDFPANPAAILVRDDELYVLTQDGIRVYALR